MLSGVRDFLSRHKRKFLVTGVVIGGATLAVRYAQRKLEAWGQQEAMEFVERARRLQHFKAMDSVYNTTITSVASTVFDSTLKTADCEKHATAIHNAPKNDKLPFWEALKIEVISRILLQMCSGSMIVILLKIQLNVVGASMLKEKQFSSEMQRKYLAMCDYFITVKMKDLYLVIQPCVEAMVANIALVQKITVQETEQMLWTVYNRLRAGEGNPIDNMSHYLIPSDRWISPADNLSDDDTRQLRSLITDTRDLLESDEVKRLMHLLTSTGCGFYTDRFLPFFPGGSSVEVAGNIPTDEEVWALGNFGPTQFARLISNIQGATKQMDMFTAWINLLLNNDTFKMFGANVYEAFTVSDVH